MSSKFSTILGNSFTNPIICLESKGKIKNNERYRPKNKVIEIVRPIGLEKPLLSVAITTLFNKYATRALINNGVRIEPKKITIIPIKTNKIDKEI